MKQIDISGSWRYETDEQDTGRSRRLFVKRLGNEGFELPGSACENRIGKKQEYFETLTREAARAPRERYEYIGPLWLQREITVPAEFAGKQLTVFLERVNLASELWLDGVQISRQIIELSAPHCYRLPEGITAGIHTLTLRIDNRNLLNFGDMASGYSIDTQGYWIGVIGRMELQCEEVCHLKELQVYPQKDSIRVKLVTARDISKPEERRTVKAALCVTAPDGTRLPMQEEKLLLFTSTQVQYAEYPIPNPVLWDEFTPALYRLDVELSLEDEKKLAKADGANAGEMNAEEICDQKSVSFGMRKICTEGRKLLLNGTQIALRGTINCAQYPLTGYPPMDEAHWEKEFAAVKEYGLNHVRFHAWCPPEAAFAAADRAGVYLSIEMPLWLNRDVVSVELGEDPIHAQYYPQEAVTISRQYGNHPSFVMFSNGNENLGDFELLEQLTIQAKAYDPRRIYTLTSNFDHHHLPCEDYFCAQDAAGRPVRLQHLQEVSALTTDLDYSEAVKALPVPVVSFEVGQYCFYPDTDIVERYTGNMLPVNFDAIRKHMKECGVYDRRGEYLKASGDLAVKLYKEDIEAAMRTKDFGGFQLLSICDYTGQSTALVGVLDIFFESKGVISGEEFRHFCGPVVPLLRAKRMYLAGETMELGLDLYDYGKERISHPEFVLQIRNEDALLFETKTTEKKVQVKLPETRKPSMLRVTLSVGTYQNEWRIFVYPAEPGIAEAAGNPAVTAAHGREELEQALEQAQAAGGGRILMLAGCVNKPIVGSFLPVFWSPVHFPSQNPCGAMIDASHPLFQGFPTGQYSDFQWKELLDHSKGMDIRPFAGRLKPMVETVPNFVDNTPGSPLFEVQCGKASVLYCGFDFTCTDAAFKENPAVRRMYHALTEYAASEAFAPVCRVTKEELLAACDR